MEIVFSHPFYLWFLLIVPIMIIAHFISLRYFKKHGIKFSNFMALARVSEKVGISSNYSVLFLRIFVFIAIILAISGTVLWYSGSEVDADYVLVIDSSASMLAEDFFPNRFEASKIAADKFVDNLPFHSSIGIISFSGISLVNQPITLDRFIIKEGLNEIRIMKSGGSDIGGAIVTGTNLLLNSGKPRVIVLITDGRANVGFGVDDSIDYANRNHVIVNTIGIGTEGGYFVEIDKQLGSLGVDINELESIASFTGGKFYHPQSDEELKSIYDEIAKSEKRKVSIDLTFFLLIFILAILFLEWILINTRYRVLP